MADRDTTGARTRVSTPLVLAIVTVVGLLLLVMLYLGLTRYFNAQEVAALVEGANENGQGYTLVIHNRLTGSYSFTAE